MQKLSDVNKDLSLKAKVMTRDHNFVNQGPRPRTTQRLFSRDVNKDLSLKAKVRTKDHNFVNQGPRPWTTSLLIGRNTDDSSVVWKYVRPVDRVRAAVAHQSQDQGLELQGKGQGQDVEENRVIGWFLTRDALYCKARYCHRMSCVCPSVRLSVCDVGEL